MAIGACYCGGRTCQLCVVKNRRTLLFLPDWRRAFFSGKCWMCHRTFHLGEAIRPASEAVTEGIHYIGECCAFRGFPQVFGGYDG